MLRHLLGANGYSVEQFIDDTRFSRTHFKKYLNGHLDIADMTPAETEKLLDGLSLSDAQAWEYFNIPPEQRTNFHTFRPWPTGHGPRVENAQAFREVRLDGPVLFEQVSLEGCVAHVDATSSEAPQLVRLGGRYLLTGSVPREGEPLGRLLRFEVAAPPRSETPAPGPSES